MLGNSTETTAENTSVKTEDFDQYRERLFSDIDQFAKDNIFGAIQKLFLGRFRDYDVYTVNGMAIKIIYSMDFVEAGNHEKWEWIPEDEIWIDNNLDNTDYKYNLAHEYFEAEQMKSGVKYDNPLEENDMGYAHPQANFLIEQPFRKRDIA
jgi:hypothetical protein